MELTILGFMGGYPAQGIGTTSYLLAADGFHLLIDVGSGSVLALEKHINPLDVDAVILTHYHPDHIADMGVLQHVFQLKEGENKHVLPIYGHTESDLHSLRTSVGVSEAVDYSGDEPITIGPFQITFMKTIHPVPCYALSIVEIKTNKKFVFSADSGYLETFITFAKDADLFLADTNFFQGKERHSVHMTSKEVGEIAQAAQVKQLVLTHLPAGKDWQQLLAEAKVAAPDVAVSLAEKDSIIQI